MGDNDDGSYHLDRLEVIRAEQYAITIGVISMLFPASVVFILLYRYNKLVRGRSLVCVGNSNIRRNGIAMYIIRISRC